MNPLSSFDTAAPVRRDDASAPLRSLLLATLLGGAFLAASAPALQAQVREGISLGVTPTAERIFWSDDLTLEDAWYYGGRASLNFGRFVALQGYYLTGDDVEAEGIGELEDALRYGGDVVFTFANWGLTPFVSAGAGVSEFEAPDGGENEILTGTAAAGIRFDLFERFQMQVFAQDVVFRASSGSPLVDAGAIGDDEAETFHNLSLGAGINFYLGGEAEQQATDRAFEEGLHGVASPLELYGGEVQWDNALGIEDVTVAGARLGVDFGPYVGLRGYYFGSLENDLAEFTDYFGYGAEGRFNLTRSDEALTPFLVLGGGRVHFPDSVATAAALGDDKKWTGVLGGGVGFNVTERLRLEVAARDLLLSRSEPEDVTAPDQLHHSWMFTGGIRFSLGGDTDELPERGPPTPRPPVGEPAGPPAAADTADAAGERPGQRAGVTDEDRELARQIRALRAEVDSLRSEVRGEPPRGRRMAADTAPPGRPENRRRDPRLLELPVLEDGEIYIRFGESGTFERADRPRGEEGDELRRLLVLQGLRELRREEAGAPGAAGRDSIGAMIRSLQAELDSVQAGGGLEAAARGAAGRAPEARRAAETPSDSVRAEMEALRSRLDSLRATSERETEERRREEELRRLEEMEESLLQRMEELQQELDRHEAGERGEAGRVRIEVEGEAGEAVAAEGAARPRGVFQGEPLRLHRISPYAGASLHEPNQLLLGLKADVGSAFGGDARLVPELTLGITDDFTWNANAHVEWPLPLALERARPYVGGGIGILDNGETELLIPNLVAGATYPVGRYELFGTIQGLDLFDDTRLVFGIHTQPPDFLRPDRPEPAEVRVRPRAGAAGGGWTDSARVAERARVEAELRRLEREREDLRAELEAARRGGVERGAGAAAAAPGGAAAPGEGLRRELADLADAPAVIEVRRTDRGAALVLGGEGVFRSGSAELSEVTLGTIRRLADLLVRSPGVSALVGGHTDARGSLALNQRLSRQRAESVRSALTAMGVEAGRISATGYGESRPIADNASAEGRSRNRRVEVLLVAPR